MTTTAQQQERAFTQDFTLTLEDRRLIMAAIMMPRKHIGIVTMSSLAESALEAVQTMEALYPQVFRDEE